MSETRLTLSVAILWFTLAIPLLSFPTAFPVTAIGMNCKCYCFPRSRPALIDRRFGSICRLRLYCICLVYRPRSRPLQRTTRRTYRFVDAPLTLGRLSNDFDSLGGTDHTPPSISTSKRFQQSSFFMFTVGISNIHRLFFSLAPPGDAPHHSRFDSVS